MLTAPDPQVARDAQAAKDVLLTRGWTQGNFEEPATYVRGRWPWTTVLKPGPVCLVGAIRVGVFGSTHRLTDSYENRARAVKLEMAVQDALPARRHPMGAITFNDHVAEGVADVLELLDKVIVRHSPPELTPVGTQREHELAGGPEA